MSRAVRVTRSRGPRTERKSAPQCFGAKFKGREPVRRVAFTHSLAPLAPTTIITGLRMRIAHSPRCYAPRCAITPPLGSGSKLVVWGGGGVDSSERHWDLKAVAQMSGEVKTFSFHKQRFQILKSGFSLLSLIQRVDLLSIKLGILSRK